MRSAKLVITLLAGLLLASLSPTGPLSASAQDGQADLDQATQKKLEARSLQDLAEVAELCESALKKGLDDEGKQYAKQLLAASLFQRAEGIAEALPAQLRSRRARGMRDLAIQDLEKVVDADPDFGEAHLLMAKLLTLTDGDRDKALKAVNAALDSLANDKKLRAMALVVRASLQKKTEDVLSNLDEAITLDPTNIEAIQLRAMLLLQTEKFDRAVEDLKRLVQDNEDNVGFLLALAEALANLGKFDEALRYVDEIIDLNPQEAFGYTVRARIHLQQNNEDAAMKDLDKALQLAPQDMSALLIRARMHYTREDYESALRDVNRIISQAPDAFDAVLLRSYIAAANGDFVQAIGDTEELLQLDPDNVPLQVQLGLYHSADDRPRKAVEVFDGVLKQEAENWSALRGRADAKLSIGAHSDAIADYERVIKAEPENSGALNNLAWVLATSPEDDLRDGKRSVELGLRACELTKYEQAHILSTLAAGYAETGDFENARKWAAKAVEVGKDGSNADQLKEELESYEKDKAWREKQDVQEKPLGDTANAAAHGSLGHNES